MKETDRNWMLKYIIEWIAAMIAFIVFLPVLFVILLLQLTLNPGPVFYCSKRIGKGGHEFTLYKFRSMKVDAKEIRSEDNKLITVDRDPRITRFGAFLRIGFDELPQLFNILKGDMCIIGPRPDIPEELTNYNERERKRLDVLPGITGLTQILDGRSLSNSDNYELDVRYVMNSDYKDDILILLMTLPFSFGMKGIGRKVLKKYMNGIDSSRVTVEN